MKRKCKYCGGFVEHLEEDGEVKHICICCAREQSEDFDCACKKGRGFVYKN